MGAGWVVREVRRWEIRVGRIQICGEERVSQQEEEHLPRAQGKGSAETCQSGLGIHRATVKTRDVSLPMRQHPLKSLLKIQMPECNPQRSPVLWSRGGGGKDRLEQERRKSWRLSS